MTDWLRRYGPLLSGLFLVVKTVLTSLGYGELANLLEGSADELIPALGLLVGIVLKAVSIVRKKQEQATLVKFPRPE